MNVLSLFDGMSCGQIALNRANIGYEKYFASEIDPFAIAVTQHNYPNTIQLGDVTSVKGDSLPKIDLLIGGSPCQGFSFAGHQLNFSDVRSRLFFEFVRLLHECAPQFFLLENVRMKKQYQDVISNHLGVEPIEIDSALVSAQTRKRLYWTNIPGITQPTDKGIQLQHIVEDGLLSFGAAQRARYTTEGSTSQRIELNGMQKANGLTTVAKNSLRFIEGKFPHLKSFVTVRTLMLQNPDIKSRLDSGNVVQFTPIECERLQTVPDDYTNIVPKSQRYRMLGNGWTVDVVAHLFRNLQK